MEEKQKTQKIELELYRNDTDLYKSGFKIGQSKTNYLLDKIIKKLKKMRGLFNGNGC